jgi:HlyD family secretion protein
MLQMTHAMDRPVQRNAWRRYGLPAAGVGLVLLVLTGLYLMFGRPERTVRATSAAVTISTVEQGVFRDSTVLNGKVQARDTLFLDALEGGQIRRVLVQAGDTVVAGQPMLELHNSQLELDILNDEGRLIESTTQLQAYERQLEQQRAENIQALDRIEYDIQRLTRSNERRGKLLAQGFAPREQLDQIQDELAQAIRLRTTQIESNRRLEQLRVEQMPSIRSQLASLRRSLSITRQKLDDLVVKAPAAGRITALDLKLGQNRNRGDRLAEITLNTGYKVVASVDEFYLGRLKAGQTAEADVHGRNEKLTVSRVYPQVQNGVFTVDLTFAGREPPDLLPGEAVTGRLYLGADRPAVVLPTGPFLERSGGDWVMVMSKNGKQADRRRVKLGRRNSEQVEVLSGLSPGERVITSNYSGYEEFQRVVLK